MPRRGSRLIFKPSSILVAFSSMPDRVRLDNNFPRETRPVFPPSFHTRCDLGAPLCQRGGSSRSSPGSVWSKSPMEMDHGAWRGSRSDHKLALLARVPGPQQDPLFPWWNGPKDNRAAVLADRLTWSLEIDVADHQLPIVSRASRPSLPFRSSALRTDIKALSQPTDVEGIPSTIPQLQHWPTAFQRPTRSLNVAADLET